MEKIILVLFIAFSYCLGFAQETGTFTDERDGKVYKTVKIGEQWVMMENFAYKPNSGNYWAYDNDTSNVKKYGYLYDWNTAKTIAPDGWHLPTKEEWEKMCKYLGRDIAIVYSAIKPGGSSGFNALLAGYRGNDGKFKYLGQNEHYWSSTDDGIGNAWNFNCYAEDGVAPISKHRCVGGLSVRFIRD